MTLIATQTILSQIHTCQTLTRFNQTDRERLTTPHARARHRSDSLARQNGTALREHCASSYRALKFKGYVMTLSAHWSVNLTDFVLDSILMYDHGLCNV